MADQPGLLEKESDLFANNNKPASNAHRRHLGLRYSATTSIKQPEMDKLLEHTLANISIAEPLTKREAEILRLIVSGKTNKEISRTFCRAERTIEYHRNRLMRKLSAHNAADLVKRAIAMGIT